ncbi:MAG: cytidylate kinase-like family protein [Eubacteriales bacterium]|nr:cytidylate kinase-like family protein [Eubacteriales bacterium]
MSGRIITISREFGSGGRTIGKETAAKLGIPCYDQELIEKIVLETGLDAEYIKEQGEYASHRSRLANAFAARDTRGMSMQDHLWQTQYQIILQLAEQGACVIVGRCADYILRGRAPVLPVFIHASREYRAKRIVEVYGERRESPEKRLKDKDERRKAYYQHYTDMEWGNAANYYVALDSGALGIETCTDIITQIYHMN